jgi:hypothetical protein
VQRVVQVCRHCGQKEVCWSERRFPDQVERQSRNLQKN